MRKNEDGTICRRKGTNYVKATIEKRVSPAEQHSQRLWQGRPFCYLRQSVSFLQYHYGLASAYSTTMAASTWISPGMILSALSSMAIIFVAERY